MLSLLQGKNIQPQSYFIVWDGIHISEEKEAEFFGSKVAVLEI